MRCNHGTSGPLCPDCFADALVLRLKDPSLLYGSLSGKPGFLQGQIPQRAAGAPSTPPDVFQDGTLAPAIVTVNRPGSMIVFQTPTPTQFTVGDHVRVWFNQVPQSTATGGFMVLQYGVTYHFPFRWERITFTSVGSTGSVTGVQYDLPPSDYLRAFGYGSVAGSVGAVTGTVTTTTSFLDYDNYDASITIAAGTETDIITLIQTSAGRDLSILVAKFADGTFAARSNWNAADAINLRATSTPSGALAAPTNSFPRSGGGVALGVIPGALAGTQLTFESGPFSLHGGAYSLRINNADAAIRGYVAAVHVTS